MFKLKTNFQPSGDQPQAIQQLVDNLKITNAQVLLGATGTGKTFTIANVIQQLQKPTLILAHNKTLAGQLYSEFKELFPENAVEYFVSYFDYYQPEAYKPSIDLFIDKTMQKNDEIEMLRLSTMNSLIGRKDVIVIASVAAIYSVPSPQEYSKYVQIINKNQHINKNDFFKSLVKMGYQRNNIEKKRGLFRSSGDVIEIFPSWTDLHNIRISLFGNEIEDISMVDVFTNSVIRKLNSTTIFPAKDYLSSEKTLEDSLKNIEKELEERVIYYREKNDLVAAERILKRTKFDIENLREFGFCNGVENYSMHLEFRQPGERPFTIFDYFDEDWLMVVDESHMSLPQIRGMSNTDMSRKKTLIDFGFRLPSAAHNRPLTFDEFMGVLKKLICVSATPGDYELNLVDNKFVEQIIRPTGLLDPVIKVKNKGNQLEDALKEIKARIAKNERVFLLTLTKKLAEELSEYLITNKIKSHYLHSELKTLERLVILNDLRKGKYDCVVGINLIREGIDLPEVSLVLIFDADKEGFLRNEKSLIQTIGRAARNINGTVILYADKMTESMSNAINETNRRRKIQEKYNIENGIVPRTIIKKISTLEHVEQSQSATIKKYLTHEKISTKSIDQLIATLKNDMKQAAKELKFEEAANLRDVILELESERNSKS
ncbi:excinuclease ABC subunit B [Mycoplasma sp. (ex Biomphalaria glabrata)]|uniref:excinuclease ABC subunit UvrB n=1 Tax=Mycoplasma sp. (ex Biomphalaria glabrata) TaxID=1749074 RepID=UPI00073AB2F0|nr:excinuclease ABC subunit UvrB [Mycoplasma sp. (ex Biomphalaria glabrata)]ALV23295.1 excinuclease ABC subunit B [Mycoplasma sp. (ex Biomphalaria glabrata)]